jgi:uncharacterized protein YjbI with pentapeptide repeats
MHWRKSDLWKAGIIVAGVLLFLVLMTWVPAPAADKHERVSGVAILGTITVQATPTVDATVTVLNKEKLQHENDWWWNYGATIITSFISTLTIAAAGIFTVVRYFNDRRDAREKQEAEAERLAEHRKAERERRDEDQQRWLKDQEAAREKRAEERFQAVIEGLSSEREEAKIGSAITLRTFLLPGYERFYKQVFDLAVAHLRLLKTSLSSDEPATTPQPTTFSQALIVVFKEVFPLARSQKRTQALDEGLDASRIHLDHGYLVNADLYQAWMVEASLKKANFGWANIQKANLFLANLQEAYAPQVNFNGSYLRLANLSRAKFIGATMVEVNLHRANLSSINLSGAELRKADFHKTNLSGANLSNSNLTETNLEEALTLKDTNLCGVKGLTKEQVAICKEKGAITDKESTIKISQLPLAPAIPDIRSTRWPVSVEWEAVERHPEYSTSERISTTDRSGMHSASSPDQNYPSSDMSQPSSQNTHLQPIEKNNALISLDGQNKPILPFSEPPETS